jgi:hypothetical protein
MKKINIVTKLLVLLLILNFSCSTYNLEVIESSVETELKKDTQIQGRPGLENACKTTTEVFAMYDFDLTINGATVSILPAQQQIIKDNFEAQMSQYFTICQVIESTCSDYDKWIVSHEEFWNYWSNPNLGQGSGSATLGVRGGQQEDLNDPYADCEFR